MRRIAVVVALALTATLFLDAAALAVASTSTTFTMEDQGSSVLYSGRIDSERASCVRNRVVKVFHKGVLIAETRSDADGFWSVVGPKPPAGDEVTVQVTKKKRRGKVICRGTSKTKTFGG